jgi:hypothetical protein
MRLITGKTTRCRAFTLDKSAVDGATIITDEHDMPPYGWLQIMGLVGLCQGIA